MIFYYNSELMDDISVEKISPMSVMTIVSMVRIVTSALHIYETELIE